MDLDWRGLNILLGQVLDHQRFGFTLHVCANKARAGLSTIPCFKVILRYPSIPSQVEIGSSIKIQFVLQHLMYGIRGSALLGDDEFGDFLLAGIAGRVWGDGGGCTLGLKVMLVGFGWMVVKLLNDGVRIDLIDLCYES